MELIIAEKPSVGRAIADALGAKDSQKGYIQGHNLIVSWCIGHLVELAMPEDYNKEYARWRYQDLPIIPEKWRYNIVKENEQQYELVRTLMIDESVTGIICATYAGS